MYELDIHVYNLAKSFFSIVVLLQKYKSKNIYLYRNSTLLNLDIFYIIMVSRVSLGIFAYGGLLKLR